jgi:plastocyanin
MNLRILIAAGVTGALLLPGAAGAATKTVSAGTPPKGLLPGVPPTSFDNAFYPQRTTIRAGDSVKFDVLGFHNVMSVPKGEDAPPFVVPGALVSGAKDAAGADFWFNNQPTFGPNPAVFGPSGDKVIDGKAIDGSGVGLEGPMSWKVTFPKKGTYTLICSIHPGMKTKITVKPKGATVPSKRQDARLVSKQVKLAAKLAKKLAAAKGPKGAVIQAGSDKKGVGTLAFFPEHKTVKAGVPVTFTMSKTSTEIHNVAFGPDAYIAELAENFFGPTGIDPRTLYPSEAPGAPAVYDGTNHGNGYINTGIIDVDGATPMPQKAAITFTKPGTYEYYCIVHGAEMKGKVTVTQ